MTASLSPLQQASKKKLSKIHLRKMSGPKLVSSPDQNHHCQKLTHTHTQMNRKIPHSFPSSSSSYFVLCASFVFLSSLNYYYYYGAIFLFWDNFFPNLEPLLIFCRLFSVFFSTDTDFISLLLLSCFYTLFLISFALFCSRKLRISVPLGRKKMVINFNHFE